MHDDHKLATFTFEHENGSEYDNSKLTEHPAIRVFNSDFIKENLKWEVDEEGIEPVLLVGEENIKFEQ